MGVVMVSPPTPTGLCQENWPLSYVSLVRATYCTIGSGQYTLLSGRLVQTGQVLFEFKFTTAQIVECLDKFNATLLVLQLSRWNIQPEKTSSIQVQRLSYLRLITYTEEMKYFTSKRKITLIQCDPWTYPFQLLCFTKLLNNFKHVYLL